MNTGFEKEQPTTKVFRVDMQELRRMLKVSKPFYNFYDNSIPERTFREYLLTDHRCTLEETEKQRHSRSVPLTRRFFLTFDTEEDALLAALFFGQFNES